MSSQKSFSAGSAVRSSGRTDSATMGNLRSYSVRSVPKSLAKERSDRSQSVDPNSD